MKCAVLLALTLPAIADAQESIKLRGKEVESTFYNPTKIIPSFSMGCEPLDFVRVDPIVSEGMKCSDHVHYVFGSTLFSKDVPSTREIQEGETTCDSKVDKSMYWTPALYRKKGGKLIIMQPKKTTVYYRRAGKNGNATVPFPLLHKMRGGNFELQPNFKLETPSAVVWKCSDKDEGGNNGADDGNDITTVCSNDPTCGSSWKNVNANAIANGEYCKSITARVLFPSCFKENFVGDGLYGIIVDGLETCPEGYYKSPEIQFNLDFGPIEGEKELGRLIKNNKLRLSNGDISGTSMHGDFISGWSPKMLQKSVDTKCRFKGKRGKTIVKDPENNSIGFKNCHSDKCEVGGKFYEGEANCVLIKTGNFTSITPKYKDDFPMENVTNVASLRLGAYNC